MTSSQSTATVNSALRKVVSWLTLYDKILIVIHQSPDGDTIASSIALAKTLRIIGKDVEVVGKDPVPEPFYFLPGAVEIKHDFLGGDWQVIVVLDCGDLKRTGFPERIKSFAKRQKRLVNIDHHPKNDLHKIANITYFDASAAAVGEMVAKIIDQLGVNYNKEIATCLLTAIYTDTGGFKHSNTSNQTLDLASRLMASGARLKDITKNISNTKPVASLKLWGLVLSRIKWQKDIGLVSSVITKEDIISCEATPDHLAGAVNLIGTATGANASLLLVEQEDGTIRGSLRTESSNVDVAKLAEIFGGGGHKKASGFTIPGRLFKEGKNWRII